jgi:hypothetical protein
VLLWLRAQHPPAPWNVLACWAAQTGDLQTLQCLRGLDPPCSWNYLVCFFAASRGDSGEPGNGKKKFEFEFWLMQHCNL